MKIKKINLILHFIKWWFWEPSHISCKLKWKAGRTSTTGYFSLENSKNICNRAMEDYWTCPLASWTLCLFWLAIPRDLLVIYVISISLIFQVKWTQRNHLPHGGNSNIWRLNLWMSFRCWSECCWSPPWSWLHSLSNCQRPHQTVTSSYWGTTFYV